MACKIIANDDVNGVACLYCSTSDVAFGPVFYAGMYAGPSDKGRKWHRYARDVAARFLVWNGEGGKSVRSYDDRELSDKVAEFLTLAEAGRIEWDD